MTDTPEQQLIKLQQQEIGLLKQLFTVQKQRDELDDTCTKIITALRDVQATLSGAALGKKYQQELDEGPKIDSPRNENDKVTKPSAH